MGHCGALLEIFINLTRKRLITRKLSIDQGDRPPYLYPLIFLNKESIQQLIPLILEISLNPRYYIGISTYTYGALGPSHQGDLDPRSDHMLIPPLKLMLVNQPTSTCLQRSDV